MKRVLIYVFGLLLVAIAPLASATTAMAIGTVDMSQVLQKSPQVKSMQSDLEKQFKSDRDKLQKDAVSFQSEVKKFQKNESVMSKSDVAKERATLSKKAKDLRAAQQDYQQKLSTEQRKKMNEVVSHVQKVINQVARQKKLDLVLVKNAVLYVKNQVNITSLVIKKL